MTNPNSEINLSDVKVCQECGVLFIPKENHYHTCPHCYKDENECDASEADIY